MPRVDGRPRHSEIRAMLGCLHEAAMREAYYIAGGRDSVVHEDRFWRRKIASLPLRQLTRIGARLLREQPRRRYYP